MSSVKKQAASSIFWSAVERFSVQGIQYVMTIIIARILLVEDFGIVAMLGIFLAVFQVFIDGGFSNALIQKKDRSEEDLSTVFYFNVALAVFLYAVLYVASPYIADFYDEPRLDAVTKVIGLTLIINSFGIIQQTRLTIDLNFKGQSLASLTAVLISGVVGVWMAYSGYGVWALVWQTLINNFLRVIILWIYSKWKPMTVFSKKSFSDLFPFGSKLLLSALLHTIYTNIYTLIIGKKFSATELGFYNRASTLAMFPSTNFTNVIVRAVYPIQCRMQDDPKALHEMFLVYLRMACYVIFPIMVGLAVVAQPLIHLLLTEKWLPAVPLFQVLCIAYMWDPVMKINHNMLNVKGRSDYFLRAEVIKKIIAVGILFATIPFGVKVMCWGLVLYAFTDMVVIIYFTQKLTGITLLNQAKELLPVVLLCVGMALCSYLAMMIVEGALIKLTLGIAAGSVFYVLGSYLFKFKEFSHLRSLLKR